jgi:hypothetical protein
MTILRTESSSSNFATAGEISPSPGTTTAYSRFWRNSRVTMRHGFSLDGGAGDGACRYAGQDAASAARRAVPYPREQDRYPHAGARRYVLCSRLANEREVRRDHAARCSRGPPAVNGAGRRYLHHREALAVCVANRRWRRRSEASTERSSTWSAIPLLLFMMP